MAAKSKGIWNAVFWIALLVCLVAVGILGYIVYSYWSANKNYEDIASTAAKVDDGLHLADMGADWDYLRSINSDIVAWVYMPGTAINYPVVHTDNNDTYLLMDFNQNEGFSARCGTIFLDCNNKPDFSDANCVLYGHHMNDGSMFACISTQLTDNAEFNAHRTIYVLTPDMNYKCETFSLVITDGYDMLVTTNFGSEKDRKDYIQDKMDRSVCQPDGGMPTVDSKTKLFTFSTCDYTKDNGRAVLFSQAVDTAVPGGASSGDAVSEEDIAAMQQEQDAA